MFLKTVKLLVKSLQGILISRVLYQWIPCLRANPTSPQRRPEMQGVMSNAGRKLAAPWPPHGIPFAECPTKMTITRHSGCPDDDENDSNVGYGQDVDNLALGMCVQ